MVNISSLPAYYAATSMPSQEKEFQAKASIFHSPVVIYGMGAFRFLSSSYTVYNSIREIAGKPAISIAAAKIENGTSKRLQSTLQKVVSAVRGFFISMTYHIIHGSLFLASGVCGVTAALHDLRAYDLGFTNHGLNITESGIYIAGAVLGLAHFSERYRLASAELPKNPSVEQLASAHRKKTSAVMGIIGCVAWIVNCAFTVIGGLGAAAFVIGLIATLTGFIKILYDYFRPQDVVSKPI